MKYLLFDARYHTHPSRATVYEVCDTKKEAVTSKRRYFHDAVIVECEEKDDKLIEAGVVDVH